MYILSIGSNQGDRTLYLKNAIESLNQLGVTSTISSIYETPSWGYSGGAYLNICVLWTPKINYKDELNVLSILQNIEYDLGRRRTHIQYTDRVIDIDIISKENFIVNLPTLKIPHAKMHLRKFVLIPLAEIQPHFFHPVLKQPVSKLIETCEDSDEITIYGKL